MLQRNENDQLTEMPELRLRAVMCSKSFFADDKIVQVKKDFAFSFETFEGNRFSKGVFLQSQFILIIFSLTRTNFIRKANKTPF
jgi:hypothetical protein